MQKSRKVVTQGSLAIAVAVALSLGHSRSAGAQTFSFNPNDLVVAVEGNGSNTGNYADNQAAPLTLNQYSLSGTTSATAAGSLELPQTTVAGGNYAISGEYGSSSEAILQLSGNGQFLTIMGYGINADTYNSTYDVNGGGTALAQSPNTAVGGSNVSRVVALVGANGSVNTTTAITGVFNQNNARSVATTNGSTFYISGQGVSGDTTEGLFVTQLGATSATAINTTYDTRSVEIINNQLYVSQDSKVGSGQLAFIATVGAAGSLPTGATTPSILSGLSTGSKNSAVPGQITLASGNGNSVNGSSGKIYISPENYFMANATTMYVTDSGDPKAGGIGDGGLQKWSDASGTWKLEYTLSTGLNLVSDTSSSGTSGLFGLTGKVVGNNVELFATNSTLTDTGQTYLYGISDSLSATSASQVTGESFSVLETAAADTDFKGVSFAPVTPVPLPATAWLMLSGLGGIAAFARKKRAA